MTHWYTLDWKSSPVVSAFIALLAILIGSSTIMPLFQKKFDPKGKFCYVTGASTGLGNAVSKHLLRSGASILAIVSQNPDRLSKAEQELLDIAGPGQKVIAISADLTSGDESVKALEEAIMKAGGRQVDIAILCAGVSKPRWFVETTQQQLKQGLDSTYWIQAWTAHALCQKMVSNRIKGKIVMVGSFLGFSTFVGYSNYSPGKYALRGLADALRSEMLLHDIDIHYFAPAGIDSPGYIQEQEFKPAPTRKLEEGDTLQTPEVVAGHLFRGLEKGYYQPTTYFITELMRLGSKGGVPGNNVVVDFIYKIGSMIGMPIWVLAMDWITKGFKKQTEEEFTRKGLYVIDK